MSKAIKCDRCHTCFDPFHPDTGMLDAPDEMVKFRNPIFYKPENIASSLNQCSAYLIDDCPDVMIDLCPACTKKFREFMSLSEAKESDVNEEKHNNIFADLIRNAIFNDLFDEGKKK